MPLRIFNTLTRTNDDFRPINRDDVRMFVCGPTVYGPMHVGHAKTYTQFDLIAGVLRTLHPSLRYVQNITDIDDKIIAKASAEDVVPEAVASRYEQHYRDMMARLGNTQVDAYVRAHDHVDAVIDQVQRLINTGHAYRIDGDGIYFDLSTFHTHGHLAKRTTNGDEHTRVENAHKRNPGDFVVWKFRRDGDPYWAAPFGDGRPGWHIEDTAITEKVFGPSYDLHGGATDLIFPHHEAEIAQMESLTGQPLVNYWMHTGLLQVDGKKMGKSLHNFVTVEELLSTWNWRTLRYAFLVTHYRSTMELDSGVLEAAEEARRRVENFYRHRASAAASNSRVWDAFWEALLDDVNTPQAFAVMFTAMRTTPHDVGRDTLNRINALFGGIFDFTEKDVPAQVARLVAQREHLRASKQWQEADKVRDQIEATGWSVRDTPEGPVIEHR